MSTQKSKLQTHETHKEQELTLSQSNMHINQGQKHTHIKHHRYINQSQKQKTAKETH